MKLIRASLLSVLLSGSILHAQAIEWSPIIQTADYEILVDIDSYQVSGGKPMMVSKTVYKTTQTYLNNPDTVHYVVSLVKHQFDCREPLFKRLSIQLLNGDNQVLLSPAIDTGFQPVVMGSDTFSIGQLTCQVHRMLGAH